MNRVVQSYMAWVRGERRASPWCLLAPAEWAVRGAVACIDFLYRHGLRYTEEPPIPFVSVGNLTYGGTNKTPFVEMLARAMAERGVRPGIVSRGYSGGRTRSPVVIFGGEGSRDAVGDEPLLLSRRLPEVPVAVARRRALGIRALREMGVELAIADDAFQHRALRRDADIVLIDAACPFGSGRLIPSGILREPVSALARAHLVVITKADQATPEALSRLRETVGRFVPLERVFTSRVTVDRWEVWAPDAARPARCAPPASGLRVLAFSAIGSPESFRRSLADAGLLTVGERRFRDHHRYGPGELDALCRTAADLGAEAMACTEKDLYNLPDGWRPSLPLLIPCVSAVLDEPSRFLDALTEALRPRLAVASNGYGEDAIGVLLARRLRDRFPDAEVLAFPLVGRGDAYAGAGFPVASAPSVTPSGGVVKYHLKDLLSDMRAGLLSHVRAQLRDWQVLTGSIRTPVCVGDVYLLLHALWGSGVRPLFVATAKTVRLSGHWRLERALIRRLALRTWTRDPESAEQLARAGANAVYAGNPVMDLLEDGAVGPAPLPPGPDDVPLVLLLPGSRLRAYRDVNLVLDAAVRLSGLRRCAFRMVLAPTLSRERLGASCGGWTLREDEGVPVLCRDGLAVALTDAPLSSAARGAGLLLGLGGTANQLCAGLGIPVVSIDEKGKRVQKKLLGDAELLMAPTAQALAEGALSVLEDPVRYRLMSAAGRQRMGMPGGLEDLVNFAASELGWDLRQRVYARLRLRRERCGSRRGLRGKVMKDIQ